MKPLKKKKGILYDSSYQKKLDKTTDSDRKQTSDCLQTGKVTDYQEI